MLMGGSIPGLTFHFSCQTRPVFIVLSTILVFLRSVALHMLVVLITVAFCNVFIAYLKPKSTYWHFNTSLLSDAHFNDVFRYFWEGCRSRKNDFISLRQWWDHGNKAALSAVHFQRHTGHHQVSRADWRTGTPGIGHREVREYSGLFQAEPAGGPNVFL